MDLTYLFRPAETWREAAWKSVVLWIAMVAFIGAIYGLLCALLYWPLALAGFFLVGGFVFTMWSVKRG